MQTNFAIEAAHARRSDAEVSFKGGVFLREFLYNLFGVLLLPMILYNHSVIGAQNRLYIGWHVAAVLQLVWVVFIVGVNVLHGMYYHDEQYAVTSFEIIFVDIMYVLRCMTIAAKYSYYSFAELREIDVKRLDAARLFEKLILAGWTRPTPHLLFAELERSLIRVGPNMCSHKILYADATSRDAMLWEMKNCIPSYLEYELGIDLAADGKSSPAVISASQSPRSNEAGEPGEYTEDVSLEARAVRRMCSWLNSGDTKYCEYDLQAAMKAAVSASMPDRNGSLRSLSTSSANGVSGPSVPRKAIPPPPKPNETTFEVLPYIPAKLVCWHTVYASHITRAPYWGSARFVSRIAGWFIAFIPAIIRAAVGYPPFGMSWASWLVEIMMIYTAALNFTVTVQYVLVAPLDFARRLAAMDILNGSIDPMSPIATEFKIPKEVRASDARLSGPQLLDTPEHERNASRAPAVFNLMPSSALPLSKVAAERVTELEGCTNHGVAAPDGREKRGTWRLDGSARVTAPAAPQHARAPRRSSVAAGLASALFGLTSLPLSETDNPLQEASSEQVVQPTDLIAVAASGKGGGKIEGWLVKRALRTRAAFFAGNSWKNRYFMGDADASTLSYSSGPGSPAIHTIRINANCRIGRFAGRPNAFRLTLDSSGLETHDSLFAAASNEATLQAWIAFLQGMVDNACASKTDTMTIAMPLASADIPPSLESNLVPGDALSDISELARKEEVEQQYEGCNEESEEECEELDEEPVAPIATGPITNPTLSTVRSSILARHRLLVMDKNHTSSLANAESNLYFPILYGENLVSWMACRQVVLDFGEAYKQRIQLYTAFFAVLCVVAIILLFFQFGQADISKTERYIMIGVAACAQISFSVALAFSIIYGAKLNDAAVLHRFRLSRIETLICDFLVAGETPGLSASAGRFAFEFYANRKDNPIQRQLKLTRQVAGSLSQALLIETSILPARVLFIPANFALLSTFGSLSMSGLLSAIHTFNL